MRTRTLVNLLPFSSVVIMTLSMMPLSCCLREVLSSFLLNRTGAPSGPSIWSGVVLPMMMSLPDTRVPGATRPSLSSFLYEPCLRPVQSSRIGTSNDSDCAIMPGVSAKPRDSSLAL